MSGLEHTVNPASTSRAGFSAMLRGLLCLEGSGAPSSRSRGRRGLAGLVMFAVFGGLALAVSPAFGAAESCSACSPWWHVTSGSRPTIIQPGSGRPGVSEVQELFSEPGEFSGFVEQTNFVLYLCPSSVACKPEEFKKVEEFATEPIAGNFGVTLLTAENVQKALEGENKEANPGYGKGNVTVKEESVDKSGQPLVNGDKRFLVSSVGASSEQAVPALAVHEEVGTVLAGVLAGGLPRVPDGELVVLAENVGDGGVDGSKVPVVFVDSVPAGLRVVGVSASEPKFGGALQDRVPLSCVVESVVRVACMLSGGLPSYQTIEMRVGVVVEGGVVGDNEVSVSGGGAPEVVVRRGVRVAHEATLFGVEDYALSNESVGGAADTQAGSHPFQQTTTLNLNQGRDAAAVNEPPEVLPAELAKDLDFKWPAGLVGNPTAFPACTLGQFTTRSSVFGGENDCPPQTAVGVAAVNVFEPIPKPGGFGMLTFTVPLFNVEPAVGEPARFGFFVPLAGVAVIVDASVRTGSDYGVTVSVHNISQTAAFLSSQVTVWGAPGDPRHDATRGWGCLAESLGREHAPCTPLSASQTPPFLTLPTSCTGVLQTTVSGDSWNAPGAFEVFQGAPMPALDGCNRLPFTAAIKVTPDGGAASTPTGLTTDVHVPQNVSQNPEGIASSNIKNITVTLPEGVVLNPAAADGLQACSEAQIGYLPGESTPGELHFTPGLAEPFCPNAAKVATVRIKSPLLPNALQGAVYLAVPAPRGEEAQNPFNTLIAMYIVAKDPVSGTLVKLPGSVSLNPVTGQITASFENNPQLPFEDAELHFFGGDRAPLATPAHCGTYTTNAVFVPWSGGIPVQSQSSFQVTTGPNGSACPSPLPFAATLAAGTTNINAGAFTPLTTTISRPDGSQDIQSIKLHMPPGVSGVLTGVKLCSEANANAGTCSAESLLGHTIVSVGLGGDPFSVTGGQVFLTEHYAGAPFGLSIVNPAKAGPFDLGKVIVRAKIEVDPHTAELTITTDASGPYAIPHILDGIPLQIKHVNVLIDRPGFTFNPTNCNPQTLAGSITSDEAASTPVAVPFQVTNCAALKFAPKFTVSTTGKTSKANGASLTVKLANPKTPFATQTNIAYVKVALPKQLPSRLSTLQKACLAAVFDTNPAHCPTGSIVGHATVHTPLLPVALTGPAYFVSHGGAAFPDLTIVLQGYGLTVDLTGNTFITKAGITTSTFKTVPDLPFNTFELTLPQGKNSALAANGNLCKTKLTMPTLFIAQNNTQQHQNTKITVTNCPKHKTHKPKHTTKKHH